MATAVDESVVDNSLYRRVCATHDLNFRKLILYLALVLCLVDVPSLHNSHVNKGESVRAPVVIGANE
jgi:hypothetical protein